VPTLPLVGRVSYGFLEHPTESFVVAGLLPKKFSGTYISPDDDNYSIFPLEIDEQWYLLIGGEGGNLPGLRLSKQKRYKKLAAYAKEHFGVEQVSHKWSDMDYRGYDELPLIGRLYPWSKHLYTATGFRKWGMTNGTVAATILTDLIMGQLNKYAEIFDSTRGEPVKNMPRALFNHFLK
jgi:glycine/D-amino acid oxidase-like deaminating enzyme